MKKLIISLLSLVVVTSAMADSLSVGQPAPDFNLPDQKGYFHKLSDLQGRWVVVYFYPKDQTPGCTKEACSFRDNISGIKEKNAVVLGISVDDRASHAEFAEKYNLQFTLLSDAGGQVARQYGSLLNMVVMKIAKRHSFIIDPEGKIAKIYRSVNPATHVGEIISALEKLQS